MSFRTSLSSLMSNSIYIKEQWLNNRMLEGKSKGFLVWITTLKSVGIRSYAGPYFPIFGLNNSKYGHFSRSEFAWAQNLKRFVCYKDLDHNIFILDIKQKYSNIMKNSPPEKIGGFRHHLRVRLSRCDRQDLQDVIYLQQLYWNRTLECVFSCKFAVYFRNTFS